MKWWDRLFRRKPAAELQPLADLTPLPIVALAEPEPPPPSPFLYCSYCGRSVTIYRTYADGHSACIPCASMLES